MIRETSKLTNTPEAFLDQVREQILALSESHDLLVNSEWRGATLSDLIEAQLKPFAAQGRLTKAGPIFVLEPNAVQCLGIAFHELATNSAKRGALSLHGGRVEIEWDVSGTDGAVTTLRLVWRELGGPSVDEIKRHGVGTVVLERVTPQALNGKGRLEFDKQGVNWTLEAPLRSAETSFPAVAAK